MKKFSNISDLLWLDFCSGTSKRQNYCLWIVTIMVNFGNEGSMLHTEDTESNLT